MTPNYRAFPAEFQHLIFCAAISRHPSRHNPLPHKDLRNSKNEFFPPPLFKTMRNKTLFHRHKSLPPKHLHQHAFFAQLFSPAIDSAKNQNYPDLSEILCQRIPPPLPGGLQSRINQEARHSCLAERQARMPVLLTFQFSCPLSQRMRGVFG
jgi:hypothetical protein